MNVAFDKIYKVSKLLILIKDLVQEFFSPQLFSEADIQRLCIVEDCVES
jgi:hypothetical protein